MEVLWTAWVAQVAAGGFLVLFADFTKLGIRIKRGVGICADRKECSLYV
jgi:hypothetical protein